MAVVGKAGGGHGGKEKLWRVTEDDLEQDHLLPGGHRK